VEADAKAHTPFGGELFLESSEGFLDCEGRCQRSYGRRENRKYRIAGHIDDAATIGFDAASEYGTCCLEGRDGQPLIARHQTRVASCVRGEDCEQSLFKFRVVQDLIPASTSRNGTRWHLAAHSAYAI
jgi:hypothetical protein